MKTKNENLLKAIKKAKLSQRDLAKRLNVSDQLVHYWINNKLPAEWVLKVETQTGYPRHKLRPDLYPKPDKSV